MVTGTQIIHVTNHTHVWEVLYCIMKLGLDRNMKEMRHFDISFILTDLLLFSLVHPYKHIFAEILFPRCFSCFLMILEMFDSWETKLKKHLYCSPPCAFRITIFSTNNNFLLFFKLALLLLCLSHFFCVPTSARY